jgi:hypothetical protein
MFKYKTREDVLCYNSRYQTIGRHSVPESRTTLNIQTRPFDYMFIRYAFLSDDVTFVHDCGDGGGEMY